MSHLCVMLHIHRSCMYICTYSIYMSVVQYLHLLLISNTSSCSCRVLYLNIILILCNGSLVGNGVGSAGACALANIVKNSTSLEELWYVLETSYSYTGNAHDICVN